MRKDSQLVDLESLVLASKKERSCLLSRCWIQSPTMKTPPLGCAVLFVAFLAIIALAAFAQTPHPVPSPSPRESPAALADYDLRWELKIPMRDKVELNATLYSPKTPDGSPSKTPVIFTLTPYISIPGTKKTANCSYVERWDEKLNKIRYASENNAGICYGASMYRPGRTPATITIRKNAD